MPQKRSISIIIPNYNGRHLLEKYLPTVFKAAHISEAPFELIIVDDASIDNSVPWVKKHYPNIRLLVNSDNRGFSYTCNQGIRAAQMDLVMLLNSDVALEENYFEALWKYFDHHDTFGVMGRILNSRGETEDSARMMAFQGLKFKGTSFYDCTDETKLSPTAYLSGANALVERKKLLALGGFDEIYTPFYVEDVDLSFRAWRLGWKCYYEHKAICHHEVSSTTKKEHTKKALYPVLYRNKFILQAIHLDGLKLMIWKVQLMILEIIPRLLIGKWWVTKAYMDYLKKEAEIRNSRKKLKGLMQKHEGYKSLFDVRKNIFIPFKKENKLK
ncbi:glycosyltransferase family 2 protein [Echinicola sp. CAU 1574]|uniref:Glycosyltransferase family 2 protein n=1 Tax=Echinicola arenosa TaxID=2774144 RepID=A0ABR9AG84_9BACT|nr:glycosyltransferase family 2 protein [Echinicola arenosa]MBD8487292.1 glycosyltransferase family 2 protein [Echinicola arenosa]